MKKWTFALACLAALAFCGTAEAQSTVFEKVQVRFSKSASDRRLVEKDATLIFDDAGRKLTVKSSDHPVSASYDDIQKVVFEVTMRPRVFMRQITGQRVKAHWGFIEYKRPDGSVQSVMLLIPEESSLKVVEKAQALFGTKVAVADFAEHDEEIKKETLKDLQSKHEMTADKDNHPLPALKPDKALVVIVCGPPLDPDGVGEGNQVKLHANDRVVAVNKIGTYSFAYLDPGDYLLVAQTENASGIRMTLEAGKEYDFLEDAFLGMMKSQTGLSRHTREMLMYELAGAYYSDWQRK
jgi:hypothetical protein